MVPLMMEEGYSAKGWLGMLLGVRLYYKFCGLALESEGAFEESAGVVSGAWRAGERAQGVKVSV